MLPYLRKDYDTSRTGSQVVPATPLRSRYLKRTVICRDILHAYPFTVCRYYITNKDFVQPINNACMCSLFAHNLEMGKEPNHANITIRLSKYCCLQTSQHSI